jgi:hypothetical protein
MGIGLFKTFLGKLFLPYDFDFFGKVSDLILTAINFITKSLLKSCLLAIITAITLAV